MLNMLSNLTVNTEGIVSNICGNLSIDKSEFCREKLPGYQYLYN